MGKSWAPDQTIYTHIGMQLLILFSCLLGMSVALPQFVPVAQIQNIRTGELISVDGENLDVAGCLVGPSGERVCPLGAFGADGQSRVQFRGNKGPGLTGSNGNAGPISQAGLPIDPAAETYKKQIEAYQKWAEQQVKNAEKQLGTAGRR